MAIQIQGYQQRREIGQGVSLPAVRPATTETGLGEAIENAAAKAQAAFHHVSQQNANSASIAVVSQFNSEAEQAFIEAREQAEPGAPDFTPGLMKKFDSGIEKIANTLPDELTRKTFRNRIAASRDNFQIRALHWEAGERQRFRVSNFSKAAEADSNQLFVSDSASRSALYASQGEAFGRALEVAEMEPGVRDQLRDEAKNRRSYSAVQGDLRDRPGQVQDWLIDRGAGEGGYYAKLRGVESGGRNIGSDTSSAFGPYQFTKGTWADLIKAHPELGLTEEDRFKPQAQEIGIRAFTADNLKILKKARIEPSPVNVYMAHFLGAGGALRFFRAGLTDEARNHVTQDAVKANPAIFKPGRTVADVLNLFAKKFGQSVDTGGGAPGYYADLSPEKRDQLYSQAETEMNKRRIAGQAAFQQRVENSLSEYAQTGSSAASPSESEFVDAMGINRGTVAYGEFAARSAGAVAGYKMLGMAPEQIPEFVESFRPEPGDPFYAEKAASFVAIQSAAATLAAERRNDPAQNVLRRFPQAGIDFRDGLNPETADAPEKLDAWVQLARANGSDHILPNVIRDALKTKLGRVPDDNVTATGLWKEFTRQRQLWGQHWSSVLRELGDGDIRVIGSGISEEAATMLLASRDKSLSDLTKPLPEGSGPLIISELQDTFTDYAQSLRLPGEDGAAFFAAGQKLAALKMVRDGVTASPAADWAYGELIGSKYSFDGPTRIPKHSEDIVDRLEDSKRDALKSADLTNLPAGVSREDAESWAADSVRWITLPDDSGVVLMHDSRPVRDVSGNAIFRNWSDLRALPVRTDALPAISTEHP